MPLFYRSTDAASHFSSTSLKLKIICSLEGWLDDIGLPQYKSQFDEGRVDGRMLHYMTVVSDAQVSFSRCCFMKVKLTLTHNAFGQDDLLGLKVGSVLHHLSIKRAIQVLRINRYDPDCLRRRPTEVVHTYVLTLLSTFLLFRVYVTDFCLYVMCSV